MRKWLNQLTHTHLTCRRTGALIYRCINRARAARGLELLIALTAIKLTRMWDEYIELELVDVAYQELTWKLSARLDYEWIAFN